MRAWDATARLARPRRRRVVLVAGAVLVAAIASGTAWSRGGDNRPTSGLTVGWGGSEGHPSCRYDPRTRTVEATIAIDGTAPRPDTVTVTVTAHADENTSTPVGSSTRSVDVDGTTHLSLLLTIAVEKTPHVDVDGETACSLSVEYRHLK